MKNSFFAQLFMAVAAGIAGGGGGEVARPVIESEKLTTLKTQRKTLWNEMRKIEDSESKEFLDAKLAVWKIDGEIKAEEAAILKSINDAKIAEARNARLQLSANYKAAILANIGKGANQQTADAEAAALEILNNELLAKYAHSKPAKSSDGTEKTGKSSNVDATCWPLFAAGKSCKEVETETGIARSTVWFSSDRYKKANNLK